MGKEVCYCVSCGHRLQGDAVLHDGRRFCQACRPTSTVPVLPPPEAPASRRASSGRLPKVAPRRKETTRVRRKRSLLVPGIAAAAAAALAVGIALAAGGSPAEPEPEPARVAAVARPPVPAPPPQADGSPALDELLEKARAIRESDLMFDRRAEVSKLLEEAGRKAGARRGEVDRLAAEYDQAFEETAARLADFARSEALRHSTRRKFAEALASLDGYPEAFRASRAAGSLKDLRRDLERKKAESAVSPPAVERKPARTPAGTSPILPLVADGRRSS